jgi:hypothetical protein
METIKRGKNRKQAIPNEVHYTINESSRQFPDDAAIACDYKVKALGIEWLSFQIRIVNCLTDKAKEMDIDWWVNDPMFRKHKPQEIPDNISQSRFGREVTQQKKRHLHLATRRPAKLPQLTD